MAHRGETTATQLGADLGLDAGHLSRLLKGLVGRGLLEKTRSPTDGRHFLLRLTQAGQEAFALLNARSREEVKALLTRLPGEDRERLLRAMRAIERIHGGRPSPRLPVIFRPHRPGDLGWVVGRHGALYAEEYGWDIRFEALVAEIVSGFVNNYDPVRERCWIAERDGEKVGSVFLVRHSDTTAKLRLLIVEPRARGLGIGAGLVRECIAFAKSAGYRELVLWTNSVLLAARNIYINEGFQLMESEPHHSFGQDLVGETWRLPLAGDG